MSNMWFILLFFPTAGFAICAWAFIDVVTRPAILFRVAGVSKRKRVSWFALLAVVTCLCLAVVGLGRPDHFLGLGCLFGTEVVGTIGVVVSAWYLFISRKWICAQLRFAER
jgi:formate-dependent nitrite reductase membrane component NrfD